MMTEYPEPSDPNFQSKLYRKWEFYAHRDKPKKPPETEEEKHEYVRRECTRTTSSSFQPLPHQRFLQNFLNPQTPYRGLLVVHSTGSGKTCAAITVAKTFLPQCVKYRSKIYVLVPGTVLKKQFLEDLEEDCGGLPEDQRQLFVVISYKTFHRRVLGEKVRLREGKVVRDRSLRKRIDSLNHSLVIVDEAHNLTNNDYGLSLAKVVNSSRNLKLLLLTATPMMNLATDIVALLNFLRPPGDQIKTSTVFTKDDSYDVAFVRGGERALASLATGYVSFLYGEDPYTFARREDVGELVPPLLFTRVVPCEMSEYQQSVYDKFLEKNVDVLDTKSESISNFVFPEDADPEREELFRPPLLANFSCKFARCLQDLRGARGSCFVYSNMVRDGVLLFRRVLLANGFLPFRRDRKYSPTAGATLHHSLAETWDGKSAGFRPATFLVVTGQEVAEESEDIFATVRASFNSPENVDGSVVKVLLVSPVANEGLSLYNVSQVHVLDAYYHLGRTDQVVGRALRRCRHKDVKDPVVKVFRYVVVRRDGKPSREQELYRRAEVKYIMVKRVEHVLKRVAVDCPVNYNTNLFPFSGAEGCVPIDDVLKDPTLAPRVCPTGCQLQPCRFRCADPELPFEGQTLRGLEDVDTSTFDGPFVAREVAFCKRVVQDCFSVFDRYTVEELAQHCRSSYADPSLFEMRFLLGALEELSPVTEEDFLNFGDPVLNKYNVAGYLVSSSDTFEFRPFDGTAPLHRRAVLVLRSDPQRAAPSRTFRYDQDWYKGRPENDVVGIVGEDANGRPQLRIRGKWEAQSFFGIVCTSLSKATLAQVALDTRAVKKTAGMTRQQICAAVEARLAFLEKHASKKNGIRKLVYLVVPVNHPTYAFPLNLEDRVELFRKEHPQVVVHERKEKGLVVYWTSEKVEGFKKKVASNRWQLV